MFVSMYKLLTTKIKLLRPTEKLFSADTFEDYEEKIKLIMD